MKEKTQDKISITIFLLIFVGFFVSFWLGENAAGGGPLDFKAEWKNHLTLKKDIFSFLYNHDYYESHLPLFAIVIVKFFPFISSEFEFRLVVFLFGLLLILIFYLNLKKRFNNKNIYVPFLILNLLLLSPYFRTSSFWGLQENLAYILFLLTIYLDSYLNFKFKKYFVILFALLCFYADQKFFFVSVIYFFKNLNLNKIVDKKNFFLSLYCIILIFPALIIFYYWKGPTPYWTTSTGINGMSRVVFNINGLLNMFQILFIYFMPFLIILNKFNFKSIIFQFIKPFESNNIIYYLFILLFGIFVFYNPPQYFTGGGALHKIYFLIKKKHELLSMFFLVTSTLTSIVGVYLFLRNFKNNNYTYFFLGYFSFISLIVFPIFQEYFDPQIYIVIFLFLLKGKSIFFKFKNLIFLNFYFFIFLIGCIGYYSVYRIY